MRGGIRAMAALIVATGAGFAQHGSGTTTDGALLRGTPLEVFAPYIGDWEINSAWGDGTTLWSRNEYRVLLGGAFVQATTWAKDGGGEAYPRYFTVYASEAGAIKAHRFTYDGTVTALDMSPIAEGKGLAAEWGEYPARIRQWVDAPEGDSYRWRVWVLRDADAEPAPAMDGIWKRMNGEGKPGMDTPPAGPYAIDSTLFVGGSRSFVKEKELACSAGEAYALFASETGVRRMFGINSRIEIAVGGPYEWYFLDGNPYGTKGGEGNQVLAFIPDRLLVFSWNAPPTQPESRAKRTWVVLEFADRGEGGCTARLTHLGFGEGEKWDETYAYFDAAWERVLTAAARAVE